MLRQEALGLRVRQRFIGRELAPAGPRQRRDTPARIVRMRLGLDQPFVLEAAQEATHQSGIETEIVADFGHVRAAMPDRIEHARRAERPATAQERGIERADRGSDGAVEAANAGNRIQHDS